MPRGVGDDSTHALCDDRAMSDSLEASSPCCVSCRPSPRTGSPSPRILRSRPLPAPAPDRRAAGAVSASMPRWCSARRRATSPRKWRSVPPRFCDGRILMVREISTAAVDASRRLGRRESDACRGGREGSLGGVGLRGSRDPARGGGDRRRHAHPPSFHHAYKLFFLCDLLGGRPRAASRRAQ